MYEVIIPVHYYGGDPATMGLGNTIKLNFESEKDARKAKCRADKCFKLKNKYSTSSMEDRFLDVCERNIGLNGWGFINGPSKIYEVTKRLI